MLNIIHYQGKLDENLSLAMHAKSGNNGTTTHKAVQSNRHTLAIFMPTVSPNSHGINTPYTDTVYGGLIGQNTIPLWGNMPSRLYAVVETCHPIGLALLTNHKGAFPC